MTSREAHEVASGPLARPRTSSIIAAGHSNNRSNVEPALTHADTLKPDLHPLLLRFPDDNAERSFEQEYGRSRAANDKRNWVFGFSLLLIILTFQKSGPGIELLPCVLLSALHGMSIYKMAASNSFRYRSILVVTLRLLNDGVVAMSIIRWTKPTSSGGAVLKHIFGTTCIVNLVYESVSHCTPIKFAVIVQGISLYMFSSQSTNGSCQMILASDGGQELIQTLWRIIHKFCKLAAWVGRVQVLDTTALQAISNQPQLACVSTVRLCQAVLGYMLPLVGMFWMERNERLRFWAHATGQSLSAVQGKARISSTSKVAANALLVMSMLAIWEATIVYSFNSLLSHQDA